MPEVTGNLFVGKTGNMFGIYGVGALNRFNHMITYQANILDNMIGLDDNTFVFTK